MFCLEPASSELANSFHKEHGHSFIDPDVTAHVAVLDASSAYARCALGKQSTRLPVSYASPLWFFFISVIQLAL